MRIQHNIMAMNAYRNYTNNVSAMKKNLEKLSSGYKINRAGDDAAGLAISEKMRAQITGLETAQKNAKDGISLVQTAEGALTEVHDMLNRMVELATQSANGTYESTTDRVQLQKEVKQLQDEINRISKAANFNGIQLLDGSMDTGAADAKVEWSDPANIDSKIANAGNNHSSAGGTDSVLRKNGITEQSPEFTINLKDFKFTADAASATFDVTIGDKTFTVDSKTAIGGTAFAEGDTMTGTELADLLATAINTNDSGLTDSGNDKIGGIVVDGLAYRASASNGVLTFTVNNKQDDNSAAIAEDQTIVNTTPQGVFKIDNGVTATMEGLDTISHGFENIKDGVAAVDGEEACAYINLAAGDIKDGTKLTIGNATYLFKIGSESNVPAAVDGATIIDMSDVDPTDADLLNKAISKLTNETNDWFTLSSPATNKLVATAKGAAYTGTGDLTTIAGLKSNFSISQMTATPASNGDSSKGLILQIGDTAADYNQLRVSIKACDATSMGVGDIDISTQSGATAAIDKIKAAINYVSDVRGTLGATQNRLDHTINNLSVMTENIQDAESTIRDTDVAEEMMAYTKNNILIQSAQAMLAQANQVPQGVLQLLQ